MLETSGLYYPNRIALALFSATEEVMGKIGLNTLLGLADLQIYIDHPPPDNIARQFDFAALAAISQALEAMYGPRGGRGMALRIGRASFARGIKTFGALGGISDAAFQQLPLEHRIQLGLQALAAVFTNFSDQRTRVEIGVEHYAFVVEISPFAWGRTMDKPVCHALVGIIQESLRWSTNGYEFVVQETECRAVGGENCVFRVNKKPVGHR